MLKPGDGFAGYTIVRLLGSGGMGEVYLAQHPRLPRQDALKILNTQVSRDDEYRQRFIREADLAARLWHPHIVRVSDRGDWDDQLWIAMDYVDGPDAAAMVRNSYPTGMPADQVASIVTAIATALDYAHQQGLLHRDVKPANILIADQPGGERRILLSDFGIARSMSEESGLTATQMTVGTVSYAAPEQLRGEVLDGRADQYALAGTAFHLLTGRPPYENSNPIAVISAHLSDPPPALGQLRPELEPLDSVLTTALDKTPANRYRNCGEFAAAFRQAVDRCINTQPTQAATPTSVPPSKPTTEIRPRRSLRRVLLTLAAVGVVAITTASAIIAYNHTGKAASGPTLEGTYRITYDLAKQTIGGAPVPLPNEKNVRWLAFRSACTSAGCAATQAKLDTDNPTVLSTTAPATATLHFLDGQWRADPVREQQDDLPRCFVAAKKIGTGSQTIWKTWTLEPQSDGTLRGMLSQTVLTNECGGQGSVQQIPFVAVRTADVPPGVTIADPPQQRPAQPPGPEPTPAGPTLDGAYRIDVKIGSTTQHNPITGGFMQSDNGTETSTMEWAFHSLCGPTRCIATAASLKGGAMVLDFRDNRWQQSTPSPQLHNCSKATGDATSDTTSAYSFEPQPDGTLRGTLTITEITNECGFAGLVLETPLLATRVGDIPPGVVLADPALFAS